MGRQKATPKKLGEEIKAIDYVPVHKKRKLKSRATNPQYSIIPLKEESKTYHLGELLIGTSNNVIPVQYTNCNAQLLHENDEDVEHLLLNFDTSEGQTTALIQLTVESNFIKDLIICKSFAINVTNRNEDIFFDLYFTTLPLLKFTRKTATCIQTVFALLYNIEDNSTKNHDNVNEESDEDSMLKIDRLYKNVRRIKDAELNLGSEDMQHLRLKPKLRPYQQSAVRWMLHREKQLDHDPEELHPLYIKVTLKSGSEVYYDKYTGFVDSNKPTIQRPSKGGILADEMGLGKTIEVLCCILQHPKPPSDSLNPSKPTESNSLSPTVDKISRKRKIYKEENPVEPNYVDKPKKLKLKSEFVKSGSKKSQSRIALETWYKSCLTPSYSKSPIKLTGIQCICGSKHKKNHVVCVDCDKIQHSDCFGYEERFGPYRCPQCWMEQPLVECGATLIVAPTSLRTQWCKEICKHVTGDFKILQYEGSSINPLYPTQLLDYDVVITTYSVLQADLRLTENEKSLTLRGERKYSPPGSCLTRVKWWRLCLDEAQTVEVPSSMVSSMAHKLEANFRWAVTGTPISKDVSDLYGLIDYLHIEPYNEQDTWKHIVYDPFIRGDPNPMYKFLAKILWRSSKNDIIDQINIPKQTVKEHFLTFSAVEQYFYKCEHSSNREAFLEKTAQHDPNLCLQSFDRSTLKKILAPLLTLRQVCTYPNSVRTRYLATKKTVTSMKDLLEALILKNTTENEEFLRAVISSSNGLAGIHLLLENPKQAVEEYRKVLSLHTRFTEEENVAKLSIDKLQVIHTMYNLNEVLGIFPDEVGRTLNDDALKKSYEDMEKMYIKKFIDKSHVALQECLLLENKVEKLQSSFVLKEGQWYCDILDWITIREYSQELVQKINNAHKTNNIECTINLDNYKGMMYTIVNWDETISKLRETLLDFINSLYEHCPDNEFVISISQDLVRQATDCHLRPQKKKKPVKPCPVCQANEHLKSYEVKLFHMSKRTVTFEEMSLKGSWKSTSEEIIFKSILSLANSKSADPKLIKDGKIHIRLLDELKKEFKEVRKFWTHLDQQICAQDELDICKMRLRLKEDNPNEANKTRLNTVLRNLNYELENRLETIHLLSAHELDYQRTILQSEEKQSLAKLEKNLGVRNYLETLKSQQYEGQTPDPCPICKNTLEQHWSIISCGHSYCLECIQLLIEQTHGERITCSVCRAVHLVSEISYIRPGETNESNSSSIRGNYSTKVEAVIKLLQDLRNEDEHVKVLVFSTWVPVLSYIKSALINNDIKCELIKSGQIEKQIERFKDQEEGVTSLLLPINLGSKGLNLIEATHVILIEPLLNPGDELQAIGRVHRIGQTKPTVVHKFVVQNTIEESIHKAINSNAADWEKNKIVLRQLVDLFTVSDPNSADVEQAAI